MTDIWAVIFGGLIGLVIGVGSMALRDAKQDVDESNSIMDYRTALAWLSLAVKMTPKETRAEGLTNALDNALRVLTGRK